MKSGWSSFFPCSNCGSQNVTGARYCGSCGLNLYYNCPDCQGWVDVTFSNCPICRVKLDWPKGSALGDKPSSPAVMLMMLGIVMLVTGSVYLIVNSSGSANAVSNKSASAAISISPSNFLKTIDTAQYNIPDQNTSTLTERANSAGYFYNNITLESGQDSTSYEAVMTIPISTPPVTDTSINSPPGRSYLDTLYPTWGHCSGGRCRNYTQ